ncbi:hypothetical protein M433DRAFT_137928 [Acidomyces richmondensis BFW]|nr:hypothetical protein M433DRAFT_137928 [Acidomyces richmondensis BFW]
MNERPAEFYWDDILRLSRFMLEQILRDWIYAICPHKDSDFPYQRENSVCNPPEWWLKNCKYASPSSLNYGDLLNLAVHLLRLRLDRDTLNQWNKNQSWDGKSWTEFLESGITPRVMNVIDTRMEYLRNVYNVARIEEESPHPRSDATHLRLALLNKLKMQDSLPCSWIDLGRKLEESAENNINQLPVKFCRYVVLKWLKYGWTEKWNDYMLSHRRCKQMGRSSNQPSKVARRSRAHKSGPMRQLLLQMLMYGATSGYISRLQEIVPPESIDTRLHNKLKTLYTIFGAVDLWGKIQRDIIRNNTSKLQGGRAATGDGILHCGSIMGQ